MAASRAQLVADIINPALTEGRHVVTDRFLASSLAYQGHASGLPVDDVLFLSLFATESLTPDLTVLIDIPVEESIKRRGQEPDRFEQENKLFHEKVRTGYLKLAEAENDKWVVIDGMGTPEEVAGFVDHAIKQRLDLP
jgi:dTMP kinase